MMDRHQHQYSSIFSSFFSSSDKIRKGLWICTGRSSICHSLKHNMWDTTNEVVFTQVHSVFFYRIKDCTDWPKKTIITFCCLYWTALPSPSPGAYKTRGNTFLTSCPITTLHHLWGNMCACLLLVFVDVLLHSPATPTVSSPAGLSLLSCPLLPLFPKI